jgi:hypothetical protein
MDWIETWFGFSPDAGDGSLELIILLTLLVVAAALVIWRNPRVGRRFASLLGIQRRIH